VSRVVLVNRAAFALLCLFLLVSGYYDVGLRDWLILMLLAVIAFVVLRLIDHLADRLTGKANSA
jgi:hypothetical protein